MKKTIFFLLLSLQALAQINNVPAGISIGTNEPTIPLSAKKLSGLKFHFSGLNPYLTFFEGETFVGYLQNISNTFEIGTKNEQNLTFMLGEASTAGFLGNTGQFYTHLAINFPLGLQAVGVFKNGYPANAGTTGQVLRSRANYSSPIWSDFNYDPQIGFSAVRNTNLTIFNDVSASVIDGLTITFQDTPNSGMNNSGIYTAPSAGHYHFDVNIPFFEWAVGANGSLGVHLYKNNVVQDGFFQSFGSYGTSNSQDGLKMSFDVILAANDVVKFGIYQSNNSFVNVVIPSASLLSYQKLTISGYKIY